MSRLPRLTILATTLGRPGLAVIATLKTAIAALIRAVIRAVMALLSPPGLERLHSDVVSLLKRQSIATLLLTLYYLAVIIGLIVLYGRGDFSTPSFVYQAF